MNNNYLEQKKNTHLYFRVGDNKYAINTENVLEIMKIPTLDYPQRLPNNIIGLLKYNNFVINVLDIRFYLDIEVKPYSLNSELLIVKTDEIIFGIITDKIIGILPFDTALVDQIPFNDNNMIVESIYKYQGDTVFIVNPYSIEKLLKQHNEYNATINIPELFPQDEASKAILAKRSGEIVAKAALRLAAGGGHTNNKYISLNLNKDFYCISLEYVKEIIKDTTITNIPGVPDFIEGIMNLRGDYITVINLKKFLGLPDSGIREKKSVIIVNCNELLLALLVDKINELFEFQEVNDPDVSEGYYLCEFINDKILYTALNIEKITSDKRIIVTDV